MCSAINVCPTAPHEVSTIIWLMSRLRPKEVQPFVQNPQAKQIQNVIHQDGQAMASVLPPVYTTGPFGLLDPHIIYFLVQTFASHSLCCNCDLLPGWKVWVLP